MKEYIKGKILGVLGELYPEIDATSVILDFSDNFGDFASNVAMVVAGQLKENPREVAETIVLELEKMELDNVEKIETAGPGFINFYVNKKVFTDNVKDILEKKGDYGKGKVFKNKTILVEYTDPNPFKVFHIGHLLPNTIGESIARLLEWNGANVKRLNYQGDVGLPVAKAVWGILNSDEKMPVESDSLDKKIKFLGEVYVVGASAYEDGVVAGEIQEINKKIYNRSDEKINEIYDIGRQWSLDHFEEIYKILGTKFDKYFFESQTYKKGLDIVNEFLEKGVFEKSKEAVIFAGEKYGLHSRVFINSNGLTTYEAKDLGLVFLKNENYKYDESIVVTGNEQMEYFKVVKKALEQIDKESAEKFLHIGHGMLRFVGGKMSSRTGNVISGEELIDKTIKKVLDKMKEGFSDEEKKLNSQKIAVSALKFSILRQSIGIDIVYDEKKSISFEGDSGPYIQYTYARAKSVIEKSGVDKKVFEKLEVLPELVTDVEKQLLRFNSVVERASLEKDSHYVCVYLIELASVFNSYYANNHILDSGDEKNYRLALTGAVAQVLKNGLEILGIETVERM